MFKRLGMGLATIIVVVVCGNISQAFAAGFKKKSEDNRTYIEERKESVCKSSNVYPKEIVSATKKISRRGDNITVENYKVMGNAWGQYMAEVAGQSPNVNNKHNELFSCFLYGNSFGKGLSFDYFGIHRDMKKSFQSGFREGYGERNSDLVMGVNLNQAARLKARESAVKLMDVYREKIIADVLATSRFKVDWGEIMDDTLRTFEEITAEGSPAESRAFLSSFPDAYENELSVLSKCLERASVCDLRPDAQKIEEARAIAMSDINRMLEEGFSTTSNEVNVLGSVMKYDVMDVEIDDADRLENTYFKYNRNSKTNRSSPLMLSDSNVTNRILHGAGLVEQINKISWLFVGQEMGRKFNHNLISRQNLIEWIKRARSIMESKSGDNYYSTSIRLLRDGFIGENGYGAGGINEWKRLREETGLKI